MNKNDLKFIRRGKILIIVFGLLSIFNIILLIDNKSYALFRRNVQSKRVIEIHTAKEFPSKLGVDILKKKLGKGGLVGIPTNCSEENCTPITDMNADESTIREYRYSGEIANNYVYFNCKDNLEQNTSNCEKWRIIGIFKDDSGQEHLKIVRNELIKKADFPETYTANGTTFKIRFTGNGDYGFWDYPTSGSISNNWTDAGLMYWLNSKGIEDGYLKTLSGTSQNMIAEAKYYLGNVSGTTDTPIQAYEHERGDIPCNESCNGGDVWNGNSATWTGKIALMYPSDMGFSTDSIYWNRIMLYWGGSPMNSSWLKEGHTNSDWFLSPSSNDIHHVSNWGSAGDANYCNANINYGVRPSLYLQTSVQIIDGNGSSEKPYELNYRAVDALKEKLGKDGLVGVTNNNKATTDKQASDIREYRYSGLGVNNYAYFNCKEGVEQNATNCETWRILGIFNDEAGQEHLKIVRNDVLSASEMPDTYVVEEKTLQIRYNNDATAYWDYDGSNYNNNWEKAALKYWLNSEGTTNGYLKKLTGEAQNMIKETKWYLGTLYWSYGGFNVTPAEAYEQERDVKSCVGNKGNSETASGCRVWANNAAMWTGKVGLMYPSDYGYSASDSYWLSAVLFKYDSTAKDTSWLQKEANHTNLEWLLSPSSTMYSGIAYWGSGGHVGGNGALYNSLVRPTIYLKSEVEITSGTGESDNPYQLSLN